jgi:hypothetical protein
MGTSMVSKYGLAQHITLINGFIARCVAYDVLVTSRAFLVGVHEPSALSYGMKKL